MTSFDCDASDRPVVAVCGAGAAGMAAALSAARAGARVLLIEAGDALGGTVTSALIHTLGGLYDARGELINGGLAEELARRLAGADPFVQRRKMGRVWVLSACPEVYACCVQRWLDEEPRIRVLRRAHVAKLVLRSGRIEQLEVSTCGARALVRTRAVVDATGSGQVARLVDAELIQRDERPAGAGAIVRLRGVAAGAVVFPAGLAVVRALRNAAAEGSLPALCATAWLDAGVRPDEVYVKLLVPDAATAQQQDGGQPGELDRARSELIEFLRRQPGFADARFDRAGSIGVRDGGRVRGEYCLTVDDVRQGRRFDDAACRCSWPIEYWDSQRGVSLEYLAGDYYEIPLRALKVPGVRNLWAAGKCLSADRYAQASARVVGCCWSMGQAAGAAAAGW